LGQYWVCTNLDKKEFISPHKLGCGLKLFEQLANHPGTGAALIILCACMPERRGGGDFDLEEDEDEFVHDLKKAAGISYAEIAKRTIGRWAGDRIALVGDYAERGDLPPENDADLIYELCCSEEERQESVNWLKEKAIERQDPELEEKAIRLANAQLYRDISDDVCAVIEHELRGKFTGEGWRDWRYDD